jgi:FixJ family two-component response regulator
VDVVFLPDGNIVFIVDDTPEILEALQLLLRQRAYEPIVFSSAAAFRDHTDFENVVCVILDINLNDGSGIELRQGLKAAGIHVPVIYMTGNADPAVRSAALDSGCIALLAKPFSFQELMDSLEKAGETPHGGQTITRQ